MDPVLNPYSPGAGRPPAALVGRDRQRDAWRVALDRVDRTRTAQPVVLYGLRGVAKQFSCPNSPRPRRTGTGSSRKSKLEPGSRFAKRWEKRSMLHWPILHAPQLAGAC